MFKKYSFIFSFLIVLSATEILNFSVLQLYKNTIDIENVSNDDATNDGENMIEKQEKILSTEIAFHFNAALYHISNTYHIYDLPHKENTSLSVDTPPPDYV